MKNSEILKYGLVVFGIILCIIGVTSSYRPDMQGFLVLGVIFIAVGSYSKIKSVISDYSSSKAQNDLLKLKNLLDQGMITQEEFDKKAKELKERL